MYNQPVKKKKKKSQKGNPDILTVHYASYYTATYLNKKLNIDLFDYVTRNQVFQRAVY